MPAAKNSSSWKIRRQLKAGITCIRMIFFPAMTGATKKRQGLVSEEKDFKEYFKKFKSHLKTSEEKEKEKYKSRRKVRINSPGNNSVTQVKLANI